MTICGSKMCIQIAMRTSSPCTTSLGHNLYQRAYKHLPFLFENGANDGFHEAIGDSIALAITPEYLKQVDCWSRFPRTDDTGYLLQQALDKVAFLPFGLLIDQWRWKVFSGEIKPADYNKAWWDAAREVSGIVSARSSAAKPTSIPAQSIMCAGNVPYMRYFLAHILEFQFYRSLCREAGYTGPLYRCSFYGNKAAGEKLQAMLEMGQSKPWPDALEVLTGQRQMDAERNARLLCPAQEMAGRAEQGAEGWVVARIVLIV